MTIGGSVIGSIIGGGGWTPIADTKFDLEKPEKGKSIVVVSDLVGKKLIVYYHQKPDDLKSIDRRKFEELVAELFQGFGYDVELTQQTRDGGKDIIAVRRKLISEKYLIECKRPDEGGYVGVSPVRELLGVKSIESATKAILVTTAHFSKDAQILFEKKQWELEGKDYNGLWEWIEQYRSQEKK